MDIRILFGMLTHPSSPIFMLINTALLTIIVLSNFIIYLKTREVYDLSKEKSLKYFRNTFLFLTLVFFTNLLQVFLPNFLYIQHNIMNTLSLFRIYFSGVSLVYLLFTFLWKKLKKFNIGDELLPHLIGIILVLLFVIVNSRPLITLLQFLLFLLFFIFSIISYKRSKNKRMSNYYLFFVILFVSLFVVNILDMFSFSNSIIFPIVYIICIIIYLKLVINLIDKISL